MHDGAAGPSREAAGPGNRLLAPRSSVLKKDSSSPAAPRPVTVTFNLDPSQEQRAAAGGQAGAEPLPLPPRPMCVRLVRREYQAAVQRARGQEETRVKQAHRAYQESLRLSRQLYEDGALSREQLAERQRAARADLTQQVAAARAQCLGLVKQATDTLEHRNREIDEYLQARSSRILQQAKHAYSHPGPRPPSPQPSAARAGARSSADVLAVAVEVEAADAVEAAEEPETGPGAAQHESQPTAEPITVQPVGQGRRRRRWTAPLRSLCRRLVRAAERLRRSLRHGLRHGLRAGVGLAGRRWRVLTGRLASRLAVRRGQRRRQRRRHRQRPGRPARSPQPPPAAPPGPAGVAAVEAQGEEPPSPWPGRHRSATSTSSQTTERRVSFAPDGTQGLQGLQGLPGAPSSWAEEWTQRWVLDAVERMPSTAAANTSAARLMVDAATDPLPGRARRTRPKLDARTSLMHVELSMRVMGTVGSVQHDPVGSVKSWRRMLYASFVYLKNEALSARLRKVRRVAAGRRATATLGATLAAATASPPTLLPGLGESAFDESSALVTRQFVESVMRSVHSRAATRQGSASDDAPATPTAPAPSPAGSSTETAAESETYTSPLSESTKNSSVEEVLLRKWNIEEPPEAPSTVRVTELSAEADARKPSPPSAPGKDGELGELGELGEHVIALYNVAESVLSSDSTAPATTDSGTTGSAA